MALINKGYGMIKTTNALIVIELIMIDHRYSDIREFFGDDDERKALINRIVSKVLSSSHHGRYFSTFVNMELDRIIEEIND